jgi:hypothetical protein
MWMASGWVIDLGKHVSFVPVPESLPVCHFFTVASRVKFSVCGEAKVVGLEFLQVSGL